MISGCREYRGPGCSTPGELLGTSDAAVTDRRSSGLPLGSSPFRCRPHEEPPSCRGHVTSPGFYNIAQQVPKLWAVIVPIFPRGAHILVVYVCRYADFFSFWSQRHVIPKCCRHSSLAVGLVCVSGRLEEILSRFSPLPTVVGNACRSGAQDAWGGVGECRSD